MLPHILYTLPSFFEDLDYGFNCFEPLISPIFMVLHKILKYYNFCDIAVRNSPFTTFLTLKLSSKLFLHINTAIKHFTCSYNGVIMTSL